MYDLVSQSVKRMGRARACHQWKGTKQAYPLDINADATKVFLRDAVDVLRGPLALLVVDKTIREQTQTLVGPNANKHFGLAELQLVESRAHTLDPASHLTGTVDVMRLHLGGEVLLDK
jgi:hypothetical protein